ncbi:MAG: hypothetical protein V9G04_14315 [Nocardioides sp.]
MSDRPVIDRPFIDRPFIDRQRLADLRAAEEQRFIDTHPRSAELAEEARGSLLAGVPMPWMTRWPGSFPLFVDQAVGSAFHRRRRHRVRRPVPGRHRCDDRPRAAAAFARPSTSGPSAASPRCCPRPTPAWVGEELARRFGATAAGSSR